ncbi:MAG: hypothetical protein WCC04_15320 [Terriglobales bacterium]
MSVSGIFSSSFGNNQTNSQYQLTNSAFQQLGNDLTAGKLSSAQSDFATLQQAFMQPASTAATSQASSSATSNPMAQELQQLSSDLKSGNLTAAQKDYSTIQNEMKSQFGGHLHGHHVKGTQDPFVSGSNQTSTDASSTPAQSTSTAAQQTYATLAQQLQQYFLGGAAGSAGVTSLTKPISFMA